MINPAQRPIQEIFADSARTSIAAMASFLIARLFGMSEAYWAPILTLVVMQSSLKTSLQISGERFIGTILGAVAGGLLGMVFRDSWWAFGSGVFALGIICPLLRLQNSYRFAGITLAIIILVPHEKQPWIVALHRSVEVSIGIVVGLVITAIWPESAEPAT